MEEEMESKKVKAITYILAEVGIIIAAANLLFYLNKTFEMNSGLGNLLVALVMLVAGIWLKYTSQK
jgi:hypothetical protein